jgi:adenine-specific DNA-methyltransferase
MPTLHWIGKDKVINHHMDVPFKVLEHSYGFDNGTQTDQETNSGNKIIHGDNLEALKALLPEYEGRVKCIYIDPPYNTGNEGWKYNDSVNDPKIKRWLGETVGKEGDDLTRHDKWLCMIYPRIKLLHKLLSDDGLIFISIDDNEYQNLKYVCDEIFGRVNFITNFTWRTDGNFDNQAKIKINHEYILCYSKNSELFEHPKVVDPNIPDGSKLFKTEIRNTVVKNGPKNPISEIKLPVGFPCDLENGKISARTNAWPHYKADAIINNFKLSNEVTVESGWSSKGILEDFIKGGFKPVKDSKGQDTTFLISKTGAIENIKSRSEASHVVSSLFNMGSTQNMSSELKKMGVDFDYPKSLSLIQYLVSIVNGDDFIVLDSFAGSGTTAHAVLNLNKKDGRNRKFIIVEMMDYVETITSKRVQHVISGYSEIVGTGGSFDFYELGQPMFLEDGNLNELVGVEKIRQYVYYTETKTPLTPTKHKDNQQFLGKHNDTAYYFHYEQDEVTTLDHAFLATMKTKAEQYVIYADNCLLTKDFMTKHNIIFKKIPRDITRF